MAAEVYIQEASKRVRDAIAALHEDIHTIQTESYRDEAKLHEGVLLAENESAETKAQSSVTGDPSHKIALEAHIRLLESEAHKKKDEITKIGSDAARAVQAKNALLTRLESIAGQLDSLAMSAR